MSFDLVASRKRLPWLWAAATLACATVWIAPWRPFDSLLWPILLLPAWIGLGHALTSLSYVVTSFRWRRAIGLWNSSWTVYGQNRSLLHLLVALPVAIIEELVFRYAGLGWLCRSLCNSPLAIIVTAVVFAFFHVRPSARFSTRQFLDRFLFAAALGTVTVVTSSIVPAIALHGTRNYILRCLLVSRQELGTVKDRRSPQPCHRS